MFSGLDSKVRRKKRKQLSRPIVNRIFDTADRIARDTALMGKDFLRKAVNYIRNQKESLRNFLLDGTAELSNNSCEQRMKPIKLDLKNSQNIGSEEAAGSATATGAGCICRSTTIIANGSRSIDIVFESALSI